MKTPPKKTPIDPSIVTQEIKKMGLKSVGLASIRELNRIVNNIEAAANEKYIRMEMGVPGFDPPKIAVDAEIKALKRGVGSKYPPFDGIPELKLEISKFVKNFIDVDISLESCFPTVGSMQGCYLAMMCTTRRIKGKNKILFIDPGFPVNKRQASVIGVPYDNFDVYEFRGDKLKPKLESYLKKGDIASLMYSNPNNPAWICFTDQELQIIGELATKYDCIVMEDLAYFGMDFRKDYSVPGQEPFIPSVAKYTNNYILLISSSKAFSLAGQRIGMTAIPDKLFNSEGNNLEPYFGSNSFGYAYIFGAMYSLSSGVSHTNQWGLTGLLKAINNGDYNFVESVKEYGDRAKVMKKLFTNNGFQIVYDMDEGEKIADGFYFTISYPGFSGIELVEELLYYGISAISLTTTGSDRHEGLRACVSLTGKERFKDLENRLKSFEKDHPK
ncbi:pyridoxal phosphate-dependent aminotransferase [Desulfobacula sp.]|uniref:pyridoxal phosphate-dependent aminotransferase n=1 Tax=Desulfobacula sp. TaxID=2593537 RepID=UPI0025C73F1B|nr:pyridoxal phosphate-dependent aminotransferase [Desulfobacula sp.]MBC2705789.1 pyridoxal phosphate-dependent aminotransferase [Desulfobacula sp.]